MEDFNRGLARRCAGIFAALSVFAAAVMATGPSAAPKRGSSGADSSHSEILLRLSAASSASAAEAVEKPAPEKAPEQAKRAAKQPTKQPAKQPQKSKKPAKKPAKNPAEKSSQSAASSASAREIQERANSAGDELAKSLLASYEGAIKARLNRLKRYPAAARALGKSGVVKVAAKLDAAGKIVGFKILAPADFAPFNAEVRRMFARAKLPAPPPELLAGGKFGFVMPIRFELLSR